MLTINIGDPIEARLRERAATNGRSPEDEAHAVLGTVLQPSPTSTRPSETASSGQSLIDEIHALFAPFGGLPAEFSPSRRSSRVAPTFD